jgi:glycosyltransferase involved in cell wall biosynthesis
MKILILLLYYERPHMVRNALHSIKNSSYKNWELAFIDDGSQQPGQPLVEEILAGCLDKIKFHQTGDSEKEKRARGGSRIGQFMNQAIEESEAETALMLCDDDALYSNYLQNLATWFEDHPREVYCHSHVTLFNPFKELPLKDKLHRRKIRYEHQMQDRNKHHLNKSRKIIPLKKVDASQVAWRTLCNKDGIWFDSPKTANLDANFYHRMGEKYGKCSFSGFFGQYKGVYNGQLSRSSRTACLAKVFYS